MAPRSLYTFFDSVPRRRFNGEVLIESADFSKPEVVRIADQTNTRCARNCGTHSVRLGLEVAVVLPVRVFLQRKDAVNEGGSYQSYQGVDVFLFQTQTRGRGV
jgi:hypothetical protein